MDKQRIFGDARDNAAIILEFTNACPFKFKNNFGCLMCSFTSPDFGPIRSHTESHEDKVMALRKVERSSVCKVEVTDLKCMICSEKARDISALFDHLIEAHDKPLKRNLKLGVVPYCLSDGFECADCGSKFDMFSNLNSHVNVHYPNFICSECGKVFTNEIRLKRHTHKQAEGKFKCPKCGEIFTTDHLKRKHMETKYGIYRHKCQYCYEYFKTYFDKMTHLNKYHGKNINYPCSMCSSVLKSASIRAAHIRRVHAKIKQSVCPICGDKFAVAEYLKSHLKTHSSEKNYQCLICNKQYAWKRSLTEHMRIHNDDRRFVCVCCGKAFIQKCSLQGHMKTHHPDVVKALATLKGDRSSTEDIA